MMRGAKITNLLEERLETKNNKHLLTGFENQLTTLKTKYVITLLEICFDINYLKKNLTKAEFDEIGEEIFEIYMDIYGECLIAFEQNSV
ncbi:MAG: hypothetical protein LBR53_07100 [Deltaproteobacteria bacterium]|jgi:hypothetical protein|nr:hypothetical protein [Deltaproteobacteria bacterium]